MSVEAYPLQWPSGRPRTASHHRERAAFGRQTTTVHRYGDGSSSTWRSKSRLTLADGRDRVIAELERLGAAGIVISSNVVLRNDGLPRSGQREPDDPGVAVYFTWNREQHCMACDKYEKVAENLAAVAKHVEAMRGQLRWGVADTRAMFAGFKALPPPSDQPVTPQWWNVLGVSREATLAEVKTRYHGLASKHHPDAGGDAGAMALINRAYEQFKKERGL